MLLHLHLSPAVFDYTDWTWLGKPHTCLYKTLQLTVHVRANENHEVKGTAWRAQRQNCGKAQIWPRLQKNSAALKVPKSTVASIILKWKTFGTTRTLPRAGRLAKLSYRGRRALVRKAKKNPKITVAELSGALCIYIYMCVYIYIRDGSRFSNIRIVNLIIEYRLGYAIIF